MLIEKGGVGGRSFGAPGRGFSSVAKIQHNI